MARRDPNAITSGRMRRGFKVGELAGSLGLSYALQAIQWPFRSIDARRQALLDAHVRNALRIVERSEELKGAFMKGVQMLSMRDDVLPAQALEILATVQSKVPPMDYALIRTQVRRELGRDPEEVFAAFAHEAFAAASLGQVHAARLPEGDEVVVKVQYPGVEATVEQDLDNVRALLQAFALIGRDVLRQKLDLSDVTREIEERLREELDYVHEAANIERFRTMLADDDEIVVPRAYPAYSSRRVLTMTRLEGYPLAEIAQPGVEQSLKDWVAIKYFRTVWRQLLQHGVLHTDPHPGNYLVTYHPKLAILDFGSVRVFPDPIRRAYGALLRGMVERDPVRMAEALVGLGLLDPESDPAPAIRIVEILCEGVIEDRPFDPRTVDWIQKGIEVNRIALKARLFKKPGHSVFLTRALAGLDAYLKQLGTVTNWHRELVGSLERAGM
jgi:predicted unusual protein kinase regulating ubiquinone biosynthesis (AarF/ABC1/UbiB family)